MNIPVILGVLIALAILAAVGVMVADALRPASQPDERRPVDPTSGDPPA